MFRFLVAHLPSFRLERCGWDPQQAVALVASETNALRVQSATPPALAKGIVPGMSQAEARALLPDLATEILDPQAEAIDLNDLSAQLLRVSPNISTLPPDALVAEISRSGRAALSQGPGAQSAGGRLAGVERALLERVRLRLEQLGHQVTVVIADDPATALACATWGRRSQIVAPGQGPAALAPLPLQALDLPPAERALLHGLGIDTVGAFARLPGASVASRLGPTGVAAHALARGLTTTAPITPWTPQDELVVHQDLPDPVVQLDALLFVINALLRDGCSRLAAVGQAASRLRLRFELDGPDQSQDLSLRLGEPTRHPGRMLRLLRLRLERFQLAAPVTAIAVDFPDRAPFDGRQPDLLLRRQGGEAMAVAIGRLQDTLGSAAVAIPSAIDRHRPESAWLPQPVDPEHFTKPSGASPHTPTSQAMLFSESPSATASSRSRSSHFDPGEDPVSEWLGHPIRLRAPRAPRSGALHSLPPPPPDRPPLMLPAPLAVDVRTPPNGLPLALHTEGRWVDVVAARGPERLAAEWWGEGLRREYWLVTLRDARRAWIYREDGRWALHGWWDR